jgi:PcfJ-like protein
MSLKTVTTLSTEWHEAVASHMDGAQYAFPAPWFPAGTIDGYEFIPLDHVGELYREGAIMHHCAGAYAPDVSNGHSYIYSVRRAGERVATLELVRQSKAQVLIAQIRGPCNGLVSKKIAAAAQKWLRAHASPNRFAD